LCILLQRTLAEQAMGHDPLKDAEIEIVCPRCGYRMVRSPARLRRDVKILCPECGEEVVSDPPDRHSSS
jgi:predicted RNA-binding Zn-ribbon protein involved in translation (DUF1610 family)